MQLDQISIGNPPDDVNVVVEIPQGSSIKYEIDKKSGAVFVDRFIHTAMVYPFNYGFIPHTHAEDGDPVDVLLISAQSVTPGCVIPARPIGMLEMEDEAGMDAKILAVPTTGVDPWYTKIVEASDLDEQTIEKIRHFFTHYKELEPGKWVKIRNILGRKAAMKYIKDSIVVTKKKRKR